jgi:ELWxxDGT repeat protein
MNRTGLMVKRWSDWFQRRGYRTDRRNVAAKQSIMNNGRRRRLRLEQLECRRLLALLPVQEAIMLGDVKPGESSSSIDSIVTLGNDTFFIENHGQLWVTRGLVGDAKLIRDFRSSTQTTWIDDLTTHSDKLVFRREVQQGVGSRTEDFLYFDPQAGEFHTWLTLEPNQYAASFWPNVFASDGSNLYFSIADSEAGNILLKADGDFLVTNLVTASFAQGGYAPIDSITPIGPEVVFTAGTKDFGYELWSTDGTQEGTKVIRDLIPSVGQPFKYSGADGLRFGQVGAIKQADFDGDGAVDFAVPGEILLGDGQGGIQRVLPYGDFTADQLGFTDFAIELLDFDLDGDQDLALVNRNLGELRVYENGFHGSMSLSFQLSVSGISRTLAVASIDSEPGEDLLVAVGNGIYQVVLGESVLLKPIAVTSGQEAIDQLKAKDLNRDGLVDLVVTEVSYPLGQSSPRISVLTKKSDGSYLSQSRPTSPDASWFRGLELAVADWNSDGLDDLVLGEISFGGLNEFGVILQGPTGFDAEISWSTLPGRLSSIETVESSDGVSSFVLIGVHSPSQWLVYPLAENLPAAGQPIGLAMEGSASGFSSGDFNGDGLTDFAMGDGDSQIITYTNFGHGSFGIYPAKQLTGEAITSVAFRNPGDAQDTILTLSHVLNATQVSRRGMIHDLLEAPLGYVPDVVLSGQATKVMAESLQGGEANDLLILFPDGPYVSIFEDGSFLKDQRIALGSGAADIATGDWNADGRWDLAVSYPAVHRIVIYQQDLQGSFAPSIIRNLDGGGDQLLAVDFNSDGIRDLLIPDATSGKLWILPGHAGGLGATQHISIPGGPVLVQMADMDQKGMLDLVAVTSDSGLVVLLRNASGDVYATQRDAMSSSAFDLDLADISGDGWTDVIVTPSSGNQTLVYYGVMNGYVGYEIPQWVGSGMRQAVVGSVEGDAVPGIFTLLQTLPSGMQGSQSFGFVVEMRHDAVRAYPISDYPFAIPRDPSNPLAYFQTYRDDDYDYYYGYTSSFHLPGSYASMKNALWVTDGTSGGTRMVYDFKDLSSYGWYAGPNYLLGGVTAPDTFQRELWVSDGTTDGTKKLMTFDDLGQVFIPLNGKIYFLASTLDLGNEWWETDGTMEGTKFAFDLVPGPVSGVSFGASAIGSPGGFYFAAYTPESGVELWFSDGTSAGTYQAADVFPGPQSSQPAGFHWTGNTLVFDALTPGFGRELWAMGAAEFDFGDAPDSYGTLLGSDGARHRLGSGLRLGALLDSEVDGFPSSAGMGDDSTGSADEDAAESVPRLVLGAANTVTLIASGTGYLDLWLDANQDGQFSHPEEHYTLGDSVLLFQGENTFQWMLPEEAMLGVTYARLRLSATGGLLPTGEAMSGEVEDHRVVIRARDMQSDWQNPRDPLDTNYSGDVKPSDALVIINYLNSVGQGVLPPNPGVPPFWYDVNGDGSATPLDALRVINYLNLAGAGGEGESAIGSMILVTGDSNLAWPFASVEVIGGPTDSNDNLVWNELEWISNETFDEVVLGGADDTTYELSGPGEDRAYTATTESVDQVMTDQELELILMTTPPLQTQLSSFWMELRKRMAGKI